MQGSFGAPLNLKLKLSSVTCEIGSLCYSSLVLLFHFSSVSVSSFSGFAIHFASYKQMTEKDLAIHLCIILPQYFKKKQIIGEMQPNCKFNVLQIANPSVNFLPRLSRFPKRCAWWSHSAYHILTSTRGAGVVLMTCILYRSIFLSLICTESNEKIH